MFEYERDPVLEKEIKDKIMEIDLGSGTSYRDLIPWIEHHKMGRYEIEETISDMLDRGDLFEPCLGYLKVVG